MQYIYILLSVRIFKDFSFLPEKVASFRYGYVPNGNRIYYLNRSQPPLLAWCLSAYFTTTNDKDFVRIGLRWLEREYQFFRVNRSYKLDWWPSPLYHYKVIAEGPRPESFREDVECAEHLTDGQLPESSYFITSCSIKSSLNFTMFRSSK